MRSWSKSAVWLTALLAVALLAACAGWTFAGPGSLIERLDGLWPLAWVGLPVAGAVISSRRPERAIGWLLLVAGTCIAFAVALEVYVQHALAADSPATPTVQAAALFSSVVAVPGFGLVPLVILRFPTDRIPSRGWRRAVGWYVSGLVLLSLGYAFRASLDVPLGPRLPNPIAIRPLAAPLDSAIPQLVTAAVAFAVAVIVHSVIRFRRSTRVERTQLKWLAAAVSAFPVLMAASFALERVSLPLSNVVGLLAFILALNGLAAAIGFAILRYRLYEIDRIVSRTAAYLAVTALLVGIYAMVAVLPSAAFQLESDLLVAAATLAAAAAFGPVRQRVQAVVDRRFNRSRYDAARVVEGFAARLRGGVDLDGTAGDLRAVVAATVQPGHVSLWLAERRS